MGIRLSAVSVTVRKPGPPRAFWNNVHRLGPNREDPEGSAGHHVIRPGLTKTVVRHTLLSTTIQTVKTTTESSQGARHAFWCFTFIHSLNSDNPVSSNRQRDFEPSVQGTASAQRSQKLNPGRELQGRASDCSLWRNTEPPPSALLQKEKLFIECSTSPTPGQVRVRCRRSL